MSDRMPTAEAREYQRLQREYDRLLARREHLLGEMAEHIAEVPEALARGYEEDAEADPEERAQNLSEAAGYWAMAGDLDRARRLYRAAIADGGEVVGDARVWYALFVLEHEDEQSGLDLLESVFAEGVDDYAAYEAVAETFEDRAELEQALHWFDAGLSRLRIVGDPSEGFGLSQLAAGRAWVRAALGLPEEAEGREAERERQRWIEPQRIAIAVFYLPEDEFASALARWPVLRDEYGSHAEHRASVESRLRTLEPGPAPHVAYATAAGYAEYVAAESADPALAQTRATYAAELARTGHAEVWPPGRNDPCWCGSSRKYKKCCGRPG